VVAGTRTFEALVDEAARAPVGTWDFGWLDGRATEERPSWRFFDLVAARAGRVRSLLDIECGVGHMLADLPSLPPLAVGVEAWPPSRRIAAPRFAARGAHLVAAAASALPLAGNSFDLVTSRHPVAPAWREIARALRPGGTYLAQHVGPHSLRELAEFLRGPLGGSSHRDPESERRAAVDAGLTVRDLRSERTSVVFFDIGAVVYFLRLVVWTVPDFTVARHRARLRDLHEVIVRDGRFETVSSRTLIEAVKAGE